MICEHSNQCSGCPWISRPLIEQQNSKIQSLDFGMKEIGIIGTDINLFSAGDQGLRERADLIYWNHKLGFLTTDRKNTFDINHCPLMNQNLSSFYQGIKKIKFPISKGSLRIRVSPIDQARGLWLDFANIDIKNLLNEICLLDQLSEICSHIEIGQKRKQLIKTEDGVYKLGLPRLRAWSKTWIDNLEVPLFSTVGGFSQTGSQANKIIIDRLLNILATTSSKRWLEFGCGSGNLSFPLIGHLTKAPFDPVDPFKLIAFELDQMALEGFQKSIEILENHKEISPNHFSFKSNIKSLLKSQVQLISGNFQNTQVIQNLESRSASENPAQALLVNPPRSGLMGFINILESAKSIQEIIYLSCSKESFISDALKLKNFNFKLEKIEIIDQFPHTPHFEILSYWIRV